MALGHFYRNLGPINRKLTKRNFESFDDYLGHFYNSMKNYSYIFTVLIIL